MFLSALADQVSQAGQDVGLGHAIADVVIEADAQLLGCGGQRLEGVPALDPFRCAGAEASQCRQRDVGSQNNLRWAAPERSAATGADMWVSHRTGRPPGAVLRSGEAYEDLLAALGVEADSGLDRAGIVFLGKRVLL